MILLEVGTTVNVFRKPIEGTDFEGKATLLEKTHPDEGDGLSLWFVEFEDEPGAKYMRTINTANALRVVT